MKMKRIALALLSILWVLGACTDERVIPDTQIINPDEPNEPAITGQKASVALKVLMPAGAVNTYAGTYAGEEDATALENRIDTLFVDLFQGPTVGNEGGTTTLCKRDTFVVYPLSGGNPQDSRITIDPSAKDSVARVGFEVDNIVPQDPTHKLWANVYANHKTVRTLPNNDSIPVPRTNGSNPISSFYMSGRAATFNLTPSNAYEGTAHLERNVAKVRVNVSLASPHFPSTLTIDYSQIKIEVLNVPNTTTAFGKTYSRAASAGDGFPYVTLKERPDGANVLRHAPNFSNTNGGQVDSFYIYENYRSSYTEALNATRIKLTIPTTVDGVTKPDTWTYTIKDPNSGSADFSLYRNYIYSLDVRVQGQSLAPLVTVNVLPWDDVPVNGSIEGTYLTTSTSEIEFNVDGEAYIDFCTDAQAVYFAFHDFNQNNTDKIWTDLIPIGIEHANTTLAPVGFNHTQDGQILLDQQHCGSFGFKLSQALKDKYPNLSFSGQICMKAGNIVKCFNFSGHRFYDAHFIVGDSLLKSGETYTYANVDAGWIQVSTTRYYNTAISSYPWTGAATQLYLQVDENLTGVTRSGQVTVRTAAGAEKTIQVTQLPAILIGRFGYDTDNSDTVIYDKGLYAEQLAEYVGSGNVPYSALSAPLVPMNKIYNGLATAKANFDATNYNAPNYFNYTAATYQAINYCAYKNRDENKNGIMDAAEIKWYLPSQAQLMAMWISYEDYRTTQAKPYFTTDWYWSSTGNSQYTTEAQRLNFTYGNLGHLYRTTKDHARCVRNAETPVFPATMVLTNSSYTEARLDFGSLPAGAITTTHKSSDGVSTENAVNNQTLYKDLSVDFADNVTAGATTTWDAAKSACANKGTNWRLPTQRELMAIWMLQTEIKSKYASFNMLSDMYYWSATESASYATKAWVVWGSRYTWTPGYYDPGSSGNTAQIEKNDAYARASVRCVYER